MRPPPHVSGALVLRGDAGDRRGVGRLRERRIDRERLGFRHGNGGNRKRDAQRVRNSRNMFDDYMSDNAFRRVDRYRADRVPHARRGAEKMQRLACH